MGILILSFWAWVAIAIAIAVVYWVCCIPWLIRDLLTGRGSARDDVLGIIQCVSGMVAGLMVFTSPFLVMAIYSPSTSGMVKIAIAGVFFISGWIFCTATDAVDKRTAKADALYKEVFADLARKLEQGYQEEAANEQ